jgi:catechol 2,3-dioxygenase-like lactoylglutathione lyase family enzyme
VRTAPGRVDEEVAVAEDQDATRPASSGRGVHHVALHSADVDRTTRFYRDVLEFPLTETRDDQLFFDVGNGNLLAFRNSPEPGPGGGLHHLAISVAPARWSYLKAKLDAAGVAHSTESGTSVFFHDPDGTRLELIADPLGDLGGTKVL